MDSQPARSPFFAFGPCLRAECLATVSRAAHPRSLHFGGPHRGPPMYNNKLSAGLWGKGIGEKIAATVSNPISCTSGGEKEAIRLFCLPLRQPGQLREATGSSPLPGLPGSLSLLHYGRMLRPAAVPARLGSLELAYRENSPTPFISPVRTRADSERIPHCVLSQFPFDAHVSLGW